MNLIERQEQLVAAVSEQLERELKRVDNNAAKDIRDLATAQAVLVDKLVSLSGHQIDAVGNAPPKIA